MFKVDAVIKNNRAMYWAGVIQLIYGLIEVTDSAAIVLISIGVIPNIYVSFMSVDSEFAVLLETFPAAFIVVFIFFTSLRLVSGYWILQNKAKGFWLAILVTGVTFVAVWFLLPMSIIDLACSIPFVILLFMGYFRDTPILTDD